MSESMIAQVLGRIPSGLFVVTVRRGDDETGMLASWVMQAGFEPPMVSVAVRRERYLADWLTGGSPFVVNVLADGHKDLLKHFGRGFEPHEPAFDGLEVSRCPRGVVVLSGTLGHLECTPTAHCDSGDHRIFLGQVIAAKLRSDSGPAVHVRKNGLKY
jgi:flavin reductase (DIM6/NTAB) family NADH-FMN oxidoreductase RutF